MFDRRIAETIDADGSGPIAATTTRFVYDGANVWADYDASGQAVARYLFGDGEDALLARWRAGDGVAWYLVDHVGTVRDVVDASGQVVDHVEYDSFGNVLSETNPVAGDRYKFTGREYVAAAGLYYYRARFYDPGTGRFLSVDPLSFAAGDENLYRYVGNQPTTGRDPSGRLGVSEASTARGALGSGLPPVKQFGLNGAAKFGLNGASKFSLPAVPSARPVAQFGLNGAAKFGLNGAAKFGLNGAAKFSLPRLSTPALRAMAFAEYMAEARRYADSLAGLRPVAAAVPPQIPGSIGAASPAAGAAVGGGVSSARPTKIPKTVGNEYAILLQISISNIPSAATVGKFLLRAFGNANQLLEWVGNDPGLKKVPPKEKPGPTELEKNKFLPEKKDGSELEDEKLLPPPPKKDEKEDTGEKKREEEKKEAHVP